MMVGHDAEAEAASRSAVETLETLPSTSAELATAYGIRAHVLMAKLDTAEALRRGQQAVELARRL